MAKDLQLTFGPVIGVNDTLSLAAQDGQRAAALTNMYAPAAAIGGDLISRPGFTRYALGTATARTGTISISAGANITGTGTLFNTELAIGDIVTWEGVDHVIQTVFSDTSANCSVAGSGGATSAYTYYPAGIKGGPIWGEFLYKNTDGTKKNYLIVQTTAAVIGGAAAGAYRFLGAGSEKLRLVEYDASSAVHPLTDRTSVTMNAVVLDITTRIYGVTFANYLILSDGTNRPRKITSAFVLSNLTDGNYAVQGSPWVYYGKLFIIDASDKITQRWSEENDPDTGYGTGTSDNSWSLRQTSADGIQGGIGTNDASYVFRQSSVAVITGAANSDFRSSGTVDAIQNIGTLSPDALVVINSSVVFRDQYGRPGRIQPGYGYIPLWKRIQEILRGIGQTATLQRAAWCRYDPVKNTVQFAYRTTSGSTTNDLMLVFDADSWECLGTHVVPKNTSYAAMDHAYGCVFLDENLNPRLTIASGTTADCAFYVQQTEDVLSASAQDVTSGGSITVAVTVRSPKVGGDVIQEKNFGRLVVGTRNVGGGTAGVTLWKSQYIGPYATAYTTAAAMHYGGGVTAPATMTLDGACVKADQQGIDINGRYIQCQFTNDTTANTRATFDTLTVIASYNDSDYARR